MEKGRREGLPNIILFRQTKESSDFGSPFGTETFWVDGISETRNIAFTLLDDTESKNSKILSDDTPTDGLALAFTSAAGPVAGVAVGEEEADSGGEHLRRQVSAFVFISCADDRKWSWRFQVEERWVHTTPCFMGKPCLSLPPVMRKTCRC
jgi:hypothetical protein